MNPTTSLRSMRPAARLAIAKTARPIAPTRAYATHNASSGGESAASRRRAVTPFSDDGHVPWRDLSAGEKTARATQQTFNFGMVIVGLVLTVSPESGNVEFNFMLTLPRAPLATFYGRMYSHPTAKPTSSTERSTRSRRISDARKFSETLERLQHTGRRPSTNGGELGLSRKNSSKCASVQACNTR